MNILDLGFFASIQSLQNKIAATDIDQLIAAVLKAFAEVAPKKLADNFITIQAVMNCVLENDGSNNFKAPNLSKAKKRHVGQEITRIHCSHASLRRAERFLNEQSAGMEKQD